MQKVMAMKKIIYVLIAVTVFVSNIQSIHSALQEEESSEIRRVWLSFVNRLSNKYIDAALEYVTEEQREDLREAFYFMIDKLPETFSKREAIKINEIDEYHAKGENVVYEESGVYSYQVIFIKDDKGEWKIRSF